MSSGAGSVLRSDRLLASTDNRLLAVAWASRNIPAGSSVFLTGPIWREHTTFPALELLAANYGTIEHEAGPTGTGAFPSAHDGLPRYDRWTYDDASGRFESKGEPKERLPQYIFTRESPLLEHHGPPQAIAQLLEASYRLKQSFRALDMSRSDYWFDMQDGFFVPFAGFAGANRPGPNIYIYERTDAGPG